MSKANPQYVDEVDLFEIVRILWRGKLVIGAFSAVALLLGIAFLHNREVVYSSRLNYSVDAIPPFYNSEQVISDFEERFSSKSVFDNWKMKNDAGTLTYSDFSKVSVVQGLSWAKAPSDLVVQFRQKKKQKVRSLVVKSNDLRKLDAVYRYAQYVNELMTHDFENRANLELNYIEARGDSTAQSYGPILLAKVSINRYFTEISDGSKSLMIAHPSFPKGSTSSTLLKFVAPTVIGGIIGVFFILGRHALKTRIAGPS